MANSVYSFSDVSLVLSHPAAGMCTITGEGVGSITVTRATDSSQHDVAADGSVMTSKIIAANGSVALSVQQTSPANIWLKKLYAYLVTAPTNEWARMSGVLKNPAVGETIDISGMAFQKRADAAYQQTGQQVTWNFLADTISG